MNKWISRSLIILFINLFASSVCYAHTQTQIQYLSGTDKDNRVHWQFMVNGGRNAGEWKTIAVPSNWEMEGFGTYRYWNDWQKDPAPDSLGLYRYEFQVPADWQGQQIEIVFGGAMTDTRVSINGQLAGPVHRGGFYEFRYDISPLIKTGEKNLLEVSVNRYSSDESVNRAERMADFWLFSGIYRPVWLEAKPPQHIAQLNIDAKHTGDLTVVTDLKLSQPLQNGQLRIQVQSLDGKNIGKAVSGEVAGETSLLLHQQLNNIIPWSAENPQRYKLLVQLLEGRKLVHETSKLIGFRTIEVRKQDGVYVNGAKVRLKGSNRHSIWPTSGRTTSKALSYTDAQLMKDMNMNAVRMSHYPPDAHFLDVADEVGLYVIDELTGWQQFYSTAAGTPLVKELVQRDQHHPSILFWANGNEGGFNRDLDALYSKWDLQQRPVIHPWANFGGIDTSHYESYDCCVNSFFHGRDVFMPTEFLHALYDGGAAAGLADWWSAMMADPLSAGGFIWAFADEGIVRADQGNKIDVAGNRAPDGIVGPYREKEGSFYAIKKIWSPAYFPTSKQNFLPASFNGKLAVENRYDFTNLKHLGFHWELVKFNSLFSGDTGYLAVAEGYAESPDVAPGMRGDLVLDLPSNWTQQHALYLTVSDHTGREIYSGSWMIAGATTIAQQTLADWLSLQPTATSAPKLDEAANAFVLSANQVQVTIDKKTGYLRELRKQGQLVPLSNGPRLVTGTATLTGITARREGDDVILDVEYTGTLRKLQWRLTAAGALRVTYAYNMEPQTPVNHLGVTFDYPETQVTGVRWLGKGPYRVWANRTQGVEFNLWQKAYNDTVTGLSWDYPEFKGYHANVYAAQLQTRGLPLTFINHNEDVALRLFTPKEANGEGFEPRTTHVDFPPGDISLLEVIAPIGTKFRRAEEHGPAGQVQRIPRLGLWVERTLDIL
jgi:hypothetical protein